MDASGGDVELVSLEDPGIRLRQGYDAWDVRGRFVFRTMRLGRIFQRRAAYFRVNGTGKVYKVFSRDKTVEVTSRFGGRDARGTNTPGGSTGAAFQATGARYAP
jgi:hypothetical protein